MVNSKDILSHIINLGLFHFYEGFEEHFQELIAKAGVGQGETDNVRKFRELIHKSTAKRVQMAESIINEYHVKQVKKVQREVFDMSKTTEKGEHLVEISEHPEMLLKSPPMEVETSFENPKKQVSFEQVQEDVIEEVPSRVEGKPKQFKIEARDIILKPFIISPS